MKINHMCFYIQHKENFLTIHKRFDNRGMYFERPGVMLQNLNLKETFKSTSLTNTNGE